MVWINKMIRPEIRSLYSPDDADIWNFKPVDEESFSLLLRIVVGPEGKPGEESFDVEVCTPRWIATNYPKDTLLMGRHLLIVQKLDMNKISEFIRSFVVGCSGETWQEVAAKIGKLARWEFEDYSN